VTPFEHARSATTSKHASLSRLVPLSPSARRHSGLYTRGIVPFTRLSLALLLDEVRHEAGELQEIGHAQHPAAPAEDNLGIGGDGVGPLPRHGVHVLLVGAQQEPRPVPGVPLADADELPPAERVERVGHPHKARRRVRRGCSSG
jgi:hypothetical protein